MHACLYMRTHAGAVSSASPYITHGLNGMAGRFRTIPT